ncbi:unnamed protein product, partial [Amoebophrya sp. A25]
READFYRKQAKVMEKHAREIEQRLEVLLVQHDHEPLRDHGTSFPGSTAAAQAEAQRGAVDAFVDELQLAVSPGVGRDPLVGGTQTYLTSSTTTTSCTRQRPEKTSAFTEMSGMFQQLLAEIQTLESQKADCELEIRRLEDRKVARLQQEGNRSCEDDTGMLGASSSNLSGSRSSYVSGSQHATSGAADEKRNSGTSKTNDAASSSTSSPSKKNNMSGDEQNKTIDFEDFLLHSVDRV